MNGFYRLVRRFRPEYGLLLLVAAGGLALPACKDITILGYSTTGNFDKQYQTIKVPIFQNITTYRGVECELTQQVVEEIQRRTPYKVVQCDADLELTGKIMTIQKNETLAGPINTVRNADLTMVVEVVLKDLHTGKILSKAPRRPGEVRPEEVPLLKDNGMMSGASLPILATPSAPGSFDQQATLAPAPGGGQPTSPGTPGNVAAPNVPGTSAGLLTGDPLDPNRKPIGFPIRATANFIPEIGQSITTATQRCEANMATQIVNMMEMGW
jgi:Lipopolysaccharide-assembly